MKDHKINLNLEIFQSFNFNKLKKTLKSNDYENFNKTLEKKYKSFRKHQNLQSMLFIFIYDKYKKDKNILFVESFYKNGMKAGKALLGVLNMEFHLSCYNKNDISFLEQVRKNDDIDTEAITYLLDVLEFGIYSNIKIHSDKGLNFLYEVLMNSDKSLNFLYEVLMNSDLNPFDSYKVQNKTTGTGVEKSITPWFIICSCFSSDKLLEYWKKSKHLIKNHEDDYCKAVVFRLEKRQIDTPSEIMDDIIGNDITSNIFYSELLEIVIDQINFDLINPRMVKNMISDEIIIENSNEITKKHVFEANTRKQRKILKEKIDNNFKSNKKPNKNRYI